MNSLELKRQLSRALSLTRVDRALELGQRLAWGRHHLRAVNYHDVPRAQAEGFAAHLRYFRERHTSVNEAELERFFHLGRWEKSRPGLILSFDDGLRSHHEVVAPLLEQHGFVGWFMVPWAFVATPPEQQREFARVHRISLAGEDGGEPPAMTREQVKDLADRGHVVTCHTATHHRLHPGTPPEQVQHEVVQAKEQLEQWLGREVRSFCWVGGEEENYSAAGARAVREAGYRFAFMTCAGAVLPGQDPLQIQRINLEAGWPVEVVRLQLGGVIDLKYLPKRRRVNRLTAAER